jgi:arginase family enzyme
MLDESWEAFVEAPLPGWCGRHGTLFGAPPGDIGATMAPVHASVFSVSFDSTSATRVGARHGPAAIRQASAAYSSQAASRGVKRLLNLRTGLLQETVTVDLLDYGDLHVYPSDAARQMQATAAEALHIARHADVVVALGGEHSITFPIFNATMTAALERRGGRTAYLQIDHHFDFGDESVLHGSCYQGSNARRIAELPTMSLGTMGFVGMGDLTSASQFDYLRNGGASIRSMRDIRSHGFEACLHSVLTNVLDNADRVYVSIDIDVCDMATCGGTGHVTVGGLSATELLALPSVLHQYPIVGLDITEVNPILDPTGATAHLAARLLFEWLCLREVDERGRHPQTD